MPNRKVITRESDQAAAPAPLAVVRDHADALLRAGLECCRQHDRFARLIGKAAMDSEEDAVSNLCHACDDTLQRVADAYAKAAAGVAPEQDEPWWHRANAVWLAAREYCRHHTGCNELTRKFAKRDPDRLGALHLEFELEASALLALRQACEAYLKVRPEAA